MIQHQYIERETHSICNEQLYWDRIINFFYSRVRESSPVLFHALTSQRLSKILSFLTYEAFLGQKISGNKGFLKRCGIDLQEGLESAEYYNTPRTIFESLCRKTPDRLFLQPTQGFWWGPSPKQGHFL
jgi:phosphatidylserine decarboxylase